MLASMAAVVGVHLAMFVLRPAEGSCTGSGDTSIRYVVIVVAVGTFVWAVVRIGRGWPGLRDGRARALAVAAVAIGTVSLAAMTAAALRLRLVTCA